MTDDRTTQQLARRGDRGAFLDLYERHAPAAWRLARVVEPDPGAAAGAVVDAFARVLGGHEPGGTQATVAAQLLRATREAASSSTLPSGVALAVLDAPRLATPAATATVDAFRRLPETWRAVLWLREVERLDPTEVGAILGMTAASVEQLGERAINGLREQFAQAQVRDATQHDCQRTAIRLGGYVTGVLPNRDAVRVRRHLDRCEECRARLDDVDDLAPVLRRTVPALPAVVAVLAEDAWRARQREPHGLFGIRLPGGQPMPAWAERSLAGATAAVVSLGITAAVLLSRDSDPSGPSGTAVAADRPTPVGEGEGESESALGDDEIVTDATSDGANGSGLDPATPTAPTAPTGAVNDAPAQPVARGTSQPTPTPIDDGGGPPPPAPPPAQPAPPDLVDTVGELLPPLDVCTGVGPVDGLTGCDATADQPGSLLGL